MILLGKFLDRAAAVIDRFDAELLLAHHLKKTRAFIISHPELRMTHYTAWRVNRDIHKRAKHIPLAYITGHKEFYARDFLVNKHTLVPRPETELLVELALNEMKEKKYLLIDIGTGSGCIPISIAATNPEHIERIMAVDISKKALAVAKKNAAKHQVPISFFQGNLLEPLLHTQATKLHTFPLLITANLPYLTKEDMQEPSIQKEPYGALYADDEGLFFYKQLFQQVRDGNLHATIFCEINQAQATPLSSSIQKIIPQAIIHLHTDLSGQVRIMSVSV